MDAFYASVEQRDKGVHNAVEAGVDTLEHGNYIAPEHMKTIVAKGIWFVPTPYVAEYDAQWKAERAGKQPQESPGLKIEEETFRRALQAGVKIAFGTDVGAFEWDMSPARQLITMVKWGMTPAQALRAATIRGAELMQMQNDIGTVEANTPTSSRSRVIRYLTFRSCRKSASS